MPATILPLLNAGRGLAIPKNEKGDLRQIVIGHVLCRLLGSHALGKLKTDVQKYFLEPAPLQFGVGVASGCELVAAAISAHLEQNPSHILASLDGKNAFNTWSRDRMWDTLLESFPSIATPVKYFMATPHQFCFMSQAVGSPKF